MHAAAIATVPRARLAAVTDVAGGAAAAFAAARGCAAEPGLDQLLARPDVDVVCVCVPSGLHAEVGVRAARAGKHLVVEKPIDVTLAAADRLIEAARAAGVALTVISQHRFDPGLIELKRLLGDGALGRLVLAEASTKWYRTQAYYDSAAWRGTWAMDGGSLMNQGIHYVDLLRWCMGPVTEVTAVCVTQAHQVEVEDTALAIVRFASGAVGTILSSTAAYPGFPQRLDITGTDGTVIVEDGRIVRRAFGGRSRVPGDDAGASGYRASRTRPRPGVSHAAESPTCWPRSRRAATAVAARWTRRAEIVCARRRWPGSAPAPGEAYGFRTVTLTVRRRISPIARRAARRSRRSHTAWSRARLVVSSLTSALLCEFEPLLARRVRSPHRIAVEDPRRRAAHF
jgi:predicted dehydrogenase